MAYGVIHVASADEFIRAIYAEGVHGVPLYQGRISIPVVEQVTGQIPKNIFDSMYEGQRTAQMSDGFNVLCIACCSADGWFAFKVARGLS